MANQSYPSRGQDDTRSSVSVLGDHRLEFLPAEWDAVGVEPTTRPVEIECSSGDRSLSRWHGFPLGGLLEAADVPDATTHVVVEGADGHRTCTAIDDALAGLLAFERDGDPLEQPRYVAPDIEGSSTVKGVIRLEAKVLSPDDDPSTFETLPPEKTDAAGGG